MLDRGSNRGFQVVSFLVLQNNVVLMGTGCVDVTYLGTLYLYIAVQNSQPPPQRTVRLPSASNHTQTSMHPSLSVFSPSPASRIPSPSSSASLFAFPLQLHLPLHCREQHSNCPEGHMNAAAMAGASLQTPLMTSSIAYAGNLSGDILDNIPQSPLGFFDRLNSSTVYIVHDRTMSQSNLRKIPPVCFLSHIIATATETLQKSTWVHLLGVSFLLLAIYLMLVQALRFRRSNASARFWQLKFPTRACLSKMTVDDAFAILLDLQQLELPLAFEIGLAGALYRPHGIPSISRVVTTTKQFANAVSGGKRVADSIVMIADFCQHAPGSLRACGAIARMNYIHKGYQKAGIVSDQDMLYTLALLAWLPIRFVQRFEWRQLTDIETNAIGVFWKSKSMDQ